MRIQVTPGERRAGGWLLLLAGLGHLLAPNLTVDLVRAAYAETLDAAFIPRDGTNTRVRLLGVAMLVVGLTVLATGAGGSGSGD